MPITHEGNTVNKMRERVLEVLSDLHGGDMIAVMIDFGYIFPEKWKKELSKSELDMFEKVIVQGIAERSRK